MPICCGGGFNTETQRGGDTEMERRETQKAGVNTETQRGGDTEMERRETQRAGVKPLNQNE